MICWQNVGRAMVISLHLKRNRKKHRSTVQVQAAATILLKAVRAASVCLQVSRVAKYIREAVTHVEEHLAKENLPGLKKRVTAPFPSNYYPELDTTEVLKDDEISYYLSQIGVL